MSFNSNELSYYSRQILLPEVGIQGQHRLKSARILIVGIGGLGCPLAVYLASAGVGQIGMVDNDRVEETNLARQILFRPEDVGQGKAIIAERRIREINPHIKVLSYQLRLDSENAEGLIRSYDITIDATDNYTTRYLLNDKCIFLKKPLVYASVSGFEGRISTYLPNQGPCYRCLFPTPPPVDSTLSCQEGGILGVLPGTLALFQATEVLKLILNQGTFLNGRILIWNALDFSFKQFSVKKNSACPSCNLELPQPTGTSNKTETRVPEIVNDLPSSELDAFLKTQPSLLIDVREHYEYEQSNIAGSISIPLSKLVTATKDLTPDQTLILYCQSGVRSKKAALLLQSLGFSRVWNLKGGLRAYAPKLGNET